MIETDLFELYPCLILKLKPSISEENSVLLSLELCDLSLEKLSRDHLKTKKFKFGF